MNTDPLKHLSHKLPPPQAVEGRLQELKDGRPLNTVLGVAHVLDRRRRASASTLDSPNNPVWGVENWFAGMRGLDNPLELCRDCTLGLDSGEVLMRSCGHSLSAFTLAIAGNSDRIEKLRRGASAFTGTENVFASILYSYTNVLIHIVNINSLLKKM